MESDDPFGQSPSSNRTLRSPPRGAEEPAPPVEAAPAETQEDVASVSVDEAVGQEGAGAAVHDEAGPVTEVPDDGGPVTAQELMQMIAESGDTIPPSDINEFAGYVSELTGQKIPATLKARRAAIANWYAEQAPPIAAHTPPDSARRRAAAALAQNPDAAFERPPMPPDRETVLRNIAQHGAQIPSTELASFARAIEALEGTKAPKKLNQRRTFIQDWFAANGGHEAAAAAASAANSGGGGDGGAAGRGGGATAGTSLGTSFSSHSGGAGGGGGGGWLDVADTDEAEQLFVEVTAARSGGGGLSATEASMFAVRLAELLGREPPPLLQQRREFLEAWRVAWRDGDSGGGGASQYVDSYAAPYADPYLGMPAERYGSGGSGGGGGVGGGGGARNYLEASPRTLNREMEAEIAAGGDGACAWGGPHATSAGGMAAGPSLQQLALRVQRAYAAGATAAALRSLSLAIADVSGVPPPAGGGVASTGEYVLDWFNFARHALPQCPARLGQPAAAAPSPPTPHLPPRAPMPRPRATFGDMDEAGGGSGGRVVSPLARMAWVDSGYDDARGGSGGGGGGGAGGLERSPVGRRPVASQRPLTAPAAGSGGMKVSPLGPVAGLGRGGGVDEEDELARMLAQTPRDTNGMLRVLESLTGGDPAADLPLSALSTVCRHVGSVSKRRVPKLVAQKRNFVRGWHLDMRAQLGLAAQGSGRAPALGPAELYAELERIFHEQNLRVTSRSSELPPAVIDRISDQIARLSGTEPPALQQERREIVYSWHRNETLKRRQDGRQDEGGRDMLRPASQGSLPVSARFDRTR